MTTEVLTASIPAGGTVYFPRGSHFYIQTAASTVNVQATRVNSANAIEKFNGVGSGFKATLDYVADFWAVSSATAQTVSVAVGDGDVTFAGAVSLVGTTFAYPTATATNGGTADLSVASLATVSVPYVTNQKRVTVGVPSTQSGSIRIRGQGATGTSGIELQPGTFITLHNSSAMEVYNPNAVAIAYYVFYEM